MGVDSVENQEYRVHAAPDFGIGDALVAHRGMGQVLALPGVGWNNLRQVGKRMQRRTLLCQQQQQGQQGVQE